MSTAVPTIPIGGIPRVNLIPRSELDRRDRASTARRWAWGVLGAILLALTLIAGAIVINWLAQQALAAEQARTTDLLLELESLSEVSGAIATEQDLIAYRAESGASDYEWRPLFTAIGSTLPAGVEIVGFDLVAGGIPQGEDPALEAGLAGTITLSSDDAIDIAPTVRAVRGVEGITMADGRLVTTSPQSVGLYTYDIDVVFDQSIYTGRFNVAEGEG